MALYKVEGPDKFLYEFEGPDDAPVEQRLAYANQLHQKRLAAIKEHDTKTGFISSVKAGAREALAGTEEALGFDKAAEEQRQKAAKTHEGTTQEDIERAKAKGVLPAAGAYLEKYIAEPLGGMVGRFGAPIVAGVLACRQHRLGEDPLRQLLHHAVRASRGRHEPKGIVERQVFVHPAGCRESELGVEFFSSLGDDGEHPCLWRGVDDESHARRRSESSRNTRARQRERERNAGREGVSWEHHEDRAEPLGDEHVCHGRQGGLDEVDGRVADSPRDAPTRVARDQRSA